MQRLYQIVFALALPFITIDLAWLTRTTGWIDERSPQRNHKSKLQQHVKKTSADARATDVDILYFQFQQAYYGYEGPNFTELAGEPSGGAQYLVRAELFRLEAISTVKFELVDENGNVIQPIHLFKHDNSLSSRTFAGFVNVPKQPFRVAISGTGIDGEPYRRIYERLFRPATGPPLPPIVPPSLTPDYAKRIGSELIALEKRVLAEFEKRASKQPDGVIVIPRIEVSNVTYESFVSTNGNRLGMQLTYDVSFSVDGDYAHSLHVFPFYEDKNIRGLVQMDVLSEDINPKPGPPSYATPQIHVDLNTLVKYGDQAWYKAGVVYRFTIKLIPDYVGQNVDNTKFCIDEEHYKTKVKSLRVWETMKEDTLPVRYRIFINEVAYSGETEPFDPPKTYYDGFLKEGAVKCKPYKNIYFSG